MARHIKASEFKAKCLALMDEVARTGAPLVITKNGKAVAELVPSAVHPEGAWYFQEQIVHHRRYRLANRCRMGRAQVILLDTQAAVRLTLDEGLGQQSQRIVDHALADDQLAMSAISFWELGTLIEKRRLRAVDIN